MLRLCLLCVFASHTFQTATLAGDFAAKLAEIRKRISSLNAAEKKLLAKNVEVGLKALALAAVAYELTDRHYKKGDACRKDGNADAFRHAFWCAAMKALIGKAWARKWSNAHETAGKNTPLARRMDLANNASGLALDVSRINAVRKADLETLANQIRSHVRTGKLVRIGKNKSLVKTDGSCDRK